MKGKLTVTLIRHGKTRANEEHRYLGRTDEPLSSVGKMELRDLWPFPPEAELAAISPMKRCRETAEIILRCRADNPCIATNPDAAVAIAAEAVSKEAADAENGKMPGILRSAPSLIFLPEWREIDFGEWEGKTWQDLTGDPDYQAWIDSGGIIPFPGGESRESFCERTLRGWKHFLEECQRKEIKAALCVVHGGTIMAIMSHLTGSDYYSFQTSCGHGWRLQLPADGEPDGDPFEWLQ